jgi:very-short-patch-repair endonuclease
MINGKNDLLLDDPNLYQPYQDYFFTSVNLDPSQEGILRNISDHKKVIIQGPPGTGKSNSLTGIIINALENKANVLVVCEKKTALEVILENLREKGLDDFCAVIDNIHSDRQSFVKRMREKLDERKYESTSAQGLAEYQNTKERHKEIYERAKSAYGNLLEEVLGDLNWKVCIGNFLKALRESGNPDTLPVPPEGFNWNSEEFFMLLNSVEESAWRMEQAEEVQRTFKDVNDELIKAEWTTADFQSWNQKLQEWTTRTAEILNNWQQFASQVNNPNRFLKPGITTRLMALIQQPTKSALQQAENLLNESISLTNSVKKDINLTEDAKPTFENWLSNLQSLQEKVREMATAGNSFRDFKTWKQHYLKQPPQTRSLLDTLQARPTQSWTSSFRAWYFNALLLQKEQELGLFPTDSRNLDLIMELEDKMGDSQLLSIREVWHEKQREQMKGRTLQQMRLLFNLRANKSFGARNSLRTLYHDQFDLLSAFFPVLLINPSVCSAMLPLKAGLFDLVIFDEASQLRLEDTFPALLRGRFKVISGDIHQMPPATHFAAANTPGSNLDDVEDDVVFSEEESLLTYAQNADFEFNYLDFHYRSRHPHLIDFSNAAFYGKRLVAMPPSINSKPIEMREVNGVYSDNTNPGEAKEIIKILFEELKPRENGEWPTVGVATLNMSQQRYLWEQIWEYADSDEQARSRLAALEANGFFIKNLENIQGDQRDIIILSTTFGKRADGSFLQNFGPLNRDKGYKMLNVIVTRARDKMIVITSVPSEFYTNFRDDIITKGNTGKGIFYAYLNYARFCSDGNEAARQELLNFLAENQGEKSAPPTAASNFLTESVFEEEVLNYMLEEIPAERIKTQFQLGGFRLDIVVMDESGAPQLVIECDGKKYHKSKVAHRYDIHRQRILERYGLVVYRIWSTNWWRDRKGEFQKLRTEIKRVCDL